MACFSHGTGKNDKTSTPILAIIIFAGRYVVWAYESALINECNYNGTQPYWDWSADTPEYGSSLEKSPLFDPVYGFGGNGANGSIPDTPGQLPNPNATVGSCVLDGPFANESYTMGPGYQLDAPNPHCLVRNFNVSLFDNSGQWEKNVVPLLMETDFFNFTIKNSIPETGAPAGIHGAGHSGTGGEVLLHLPILKHFR
jgi:tyrosinase